MVMDHRLSEQQFQIRRLQRRLVTMETAVEEGKGRAAIERVIAELQQLKAALGWAPAS